MAATTMPLLPLVMSKSTASGNVADQPRAALPANRGREFAKMLRESATDRTPAAVREPVRATTNASANSRRDTLPAAPSPQTDTSNTDVAAQEKDLPLPASLAPIAKALFSETGLSDTQPLTATDASTLLERLSSLQQNGQPIDQRLAAALSDGLQSIVETDEPLSLQEIFASNRYMNPNVALNSTPQANNALAAAAETQPSADITSPNALLNTETTISASPSSEEVSPASVDEKSEEKSGADEAANAAAPVTGVIITPMAQSLVIPFTAPITVPAASVTQATAAPTDSVSAAELSRKAVSIDTLIPSLELKPEVKTPALPEVELPKTASAKEQQAQPTEVAALQSRIPTKLEKQLEALNVTSSSSGEKSQTAAPVLSLAENTTTPAAAANMNDTNVPAAAMATAAIAASQPVTATPSVSAIALPQGIVNHAPIREQVHVAVSKAAESGVDQITIQLDPIGLGRVEVKMHTGHDGQTQLAFTIDKPETFDALSRDARGLERTLQESGLKADSGSMQFNLRQQPQQQQADMSGNNNHSPSGNTPENETNSAAPKGIEHHAAATAMTKTYQIGIHDGLDIRA